MELDELGRILRERRLDRALSQEDIARAVRISRPTLSQLENGKLAEIGIRKVMEVLAQVGLELTVREAHVRPTLRELTNERDTGLLDASPGTRQRAPRKIKKAALPRAEA